MSEIDFKDLNRHALTQCPALLERLLPGGVLSGREYQAANLAGGKGKSLNVNIETGRWADFASQEKGGDLIALVAAIDGINQYQAARKLVGLVNYSLPEKKDGGAAPVFPAPENAPDPDFTHPKKGKPSEVYAYRDQQGRLLGYTARFVLEEWDAAKGKHKKVFCPLVRAAGGWRWKGFNKPYPFYGLENLAKTPLDLPVVILEGEHKADVLSAAIGGNMAVLGLYGGSGKVGDMDFSPLHGRNVIYWPDNDAPGFKAALSFAEKARGIAASVKIIQPSADVKESWDVADAIEKDGWDFNKIRDWISVNRLDPEEFKRLAGADAETSQQDKQPLKAIDIASFITMDIQPRKAILSPILREKGHAMLYAPRGVGKTFIALYIAWTVASGGKLFDRWEAPEPRRVLLIDGEMPAEALQSRLKEIGAAAKTDITTAKNLVILSADLQPEGIPNLATEEGQKAVEPFIDQADLIILDNLSTLYSYGKSNDAESWLPMQQWLLKLRRKRKTAIVIHHAGKNGDQRGTSAREDIFETVIKLQQPKDYEDRQGARFEVYFTKHRGFFGDDARPFEAWLTADSNNLSRWKIRTVEEAEKDQVMELIDMGYSVRECAEELGISKSKVDRLKRKALSDKIRQ